MPTPFFPTLGDEFPILTFASATGDFASYSGLQLSPLLFLAPKQTAGDFRLVAATLGDANLDGVVNGLDANLLSLNWLASGAGYAAGDVNLDGQVNGLDANVISLNWLAGGPASPIPEPSGLLLGLLALAAAVVPRRLAHG